MRTKDRVGSYREGDGDDARTAAQRAVSDEYVATELARRFSGRTPTFAEASAVVDEICASMPPIGIEL